MAQVPGSSIGELLGGVADLLRGIASLGWLIFWAVLAIAYRRDVGRALSRLKRGKGFGVELELEESLRELSEKAEEAKTETASAVDRGTPEREAGGDEVVEAVFREAGQSPRAALMLLSAEIERQLQLLGAQSGWQRGGPSGRMWQFLLRNGVVASNLGGALELFRGVRNAIVHGGSAAEADILRALDSGVVLLRAILQVPREVNRIGATNIPLFSDAEGTQPIPDAFGVMLETTSPGGVEGSSRVFPTTRTDYVVGKMVSWEWNSGRQFGRTWYRDPTSGELKQAWEGSMEFVGRHLD